MCIKRRLLTIIISFMLIMIVPINTLAAVEDPVMHKGVFSWKTRVKEATSGIRYRTIGWMIHKNKVSDGNIARSKEPFAVIKQQQVREEGQGTGTLTTYFKANKEDIKNTLVNFSAQNKDTPILWSSGETVYVSAIFEVRRYSSKGSKVDGNGKPVDEHYLNYGRKR